jgi:4-hydroxy-tetrahydrodipicolinate reductase
MSLRVAILGATGRMGRALLAEILTADDLTLAGAYTHAGSASLGIDAGRLVGHEPVDQEVTVLEAAPPADVLIDVALPAGLLAALPHLTTTPVVSGSTGLSASERQRLDQHPGPLLLAANFSTGVTLLEALVGLAARTLPGADVEIVEAHHRQKVDAPSGTALALAQRVADTRGVALEAVRDDGRSGRTGPRASGRIGLHALRGGSVTGHHTVWLMGDRERLQLAHEAEDRTVFALGALRAARWLAGRPPGRYTMHDALGLSAMLGSAEDATGRAG